jgi:hypothetical protein
LTDAEWELLPGNWLEKGLGYTAKPANDVVRNWMIWCET